MEFNELKKDMILELPPGTLKEKNFVIILDKLDTSLEVLHITKEAGHIDEYKSKISLKRWNDYRFIYYHFLISNKKELIEGIFDEI